jgi:site-specific DNA recombinase
VSRPAPLWSPRSRVAGAGFDEIVAGTVITVEQIAAREKCSIRQVHMTISLAFLAPGLVKAAIEGRLPRGIGVTHLRDAPAEWARQYAMLGLPI